HLSFAFASMSIYVHPIVNHALTQFVNYLTLDTNPSPTLYKNFRLNLDFYICICYNADITTNTKKREVNIMFSRKFIKATENFCTYEKNVHAPYIRKEFNLSKAPEKASVNLTCTGFYRFFVNGKELTASRLAPAITNPDDILFYDTYDVAEHLTEGINVFGFILGNGISNCMGGYIWDFDKAVFRSAPKLALSFESDELSFEADRSFVTAPSPIYFDDMRSGEFYDATLEKNGWNESSYAASDWASVIETEAPRGKTLANDTDKIVITKELEAEEIVKGTISGIEFSAGIRGDSLEISKTTFYKPDENESGYIFKFAENTACVPRLRIKGKKGQKIIIQAAEFCSDNNVISYENIQRFYPFGFCQRDIYICKGEGVEEYIPSFTYHGARYFIVMGLEDSQVSKETLTMLVQNSDIKERGGFDCSDEIANALQRNTKISDLANFVYFPTDCPHREKNGWTGDAAMSAEQMHQNLAPERSHKQWLRQICASQREDGALPGIVPTSGWGFDWGNGPAWDEVITELPYQIYKYRGDLSLFEVVSDSVIKYLNYASKRRRSDGLIAIGLGDWCHASRHGGSNHVCPLEVSDTAIVYDMCNKAEIMFKALGLNIQAGFCNALGKELRDAFRARLINYNTMTVKGNCQGAQSIGLYYGLFDNGEIPSAYAKLVSLIHEADDHFDCGMIGLRTIFRVLGAHGDAELAYSMITRTDAPSYGIWV
ncbi:MAG: family 78 glycoside hydrolase catalytic domain, partial [Clostridia bacterium]|nr:family 78 glycoside hydrolase catalytic domain [Clostridia bacterium]